MVAVADVAWAYSQPASFLIVLALSRSRLDGVIGSYAIGIQAGPIYRHRQVSSVKLYLAKTC
jgi:hypothetical protein